VKKEKEKRKICLSGKRRGGLGFRVCVCVCERERERERESGCVGACWVGERSQCAPACGIADRVTFEWQQKKNAEHDRKDVGGLMGRYFPEIKDICQEGKKMERFGRDMAGDYNVIDIGSVGNSFRGFRACQVGVCVCGCVCVCVWR